MKTLKVSEVGVPEHKDDQLLVKTHFASINPIDWKLVTGGYDGFFPVKKFPYVPGFDICGKVEKVGANVTKFKVGDVVICDLGLKETMGDMIEKVPHGGALAEYCVVPENMAVLKPTRLSDAEGAALNLAGLTALQGLKDHHNLQQGQRVLILGGSGGVGHLAIQ